MFSNTYFLSSFFLTIAMEHIEQQHEEQIPSVRSAPKPPLKEKTATSSYFGEIIRFSILAILIVVPIRLFIAQPFVVSGASMEPTFHDGEYLIVDQLTYAFEAPERGSVIIFKYPEDPSKFFIKRVIGLPGETVQLRGKDVIIKNDAHPSGFILDEPYLESARRDSNNSTITLANDEYFVMGDNRKASSDSRVWGPLDENYLVGRAFLRLLPVTRGGVFPGDYESFETNAEK